MSGGSVKQEMEGLEGEWDNLFEMGGGPEEVETLRDLEVKVKQEPGWMSEREDLRRGDGGDDQMGQLITLKRRKEGGDDSKHLKRNRVEGEKKPEVESEMGLQDHCIFCLKKITDNTSGAQETVTRARFSRSTASTLLSTVNQLWPYLQHTIKDSENLIPFIERMGAETRNFTGFTELPAMCGVCADKLKSVSKLLKDLEIQIRRFASLIQESNVTQMLKSLKESNVESEEEPEHCPDSPLSPHQQASPDVQNEDLFHDVDGPQSPTASEVDSSSGSEEESRPQVRKSTRRSERFRSYKDNDERGLYDKLPQSPNPADEDSECDQDSDFYPSSDEKSKPKSSKATKKRKRRSNKNEDYHPDLACRKCDKILGSRTALRYHMKHVHDPGKKTKLDKDLPQICDICGKILSSHRNLIRHKRTAHGNNKQNKVIGNPCDLCKDRVLNLYEHLKQHVGEDYVIKCPNPKCHMAFTQLKSLCEHVKTNKACQNGAPPGVQLPELTYICEVCQFSTDRAHSLNSHLTLNHENPTKNFPCPVHGCSQSFTLRQSVVLHLPHHDFPRQSQYCPLCKELNKLDNIEAHLKDKHQVSEIIKCKQCPFLFSTREQLLEHFHNHRYGDLMCDICGDGVKYSRLSILRDHYFTVHKIGEKILCDQCDKTFWTKESLISHQKEKHNQEESNNVPEKRKMFRCEECDLEWGIEITLKEHNIHVHGAEPFVCTFCTETFTKKDLLTKHVREHQGVKTGLAKEFKCEVEGCEKSFKERRLLKWHNEATHLGIRQFCELCGKSYADIRALQRHKDFVHLGLRPFVCDVCGEGFGSGTNLRRHKRIHTGERPFPCEICGQRFRQKVGLTNHLEGHLTKGADFKPTGSMKQIRKRVEKKK